MLVVGNLVFAQVMSSGSYSIQSDSLNFGGGLSSSTNYIQESTFGEIATGPGESSSYKLKAGYQQMHEVYLAISAAADVTLSPSIDGTTGGTADGSTSVTVTTDNSTGYALYIKASSSPALVSGANSFADYIPAGANPDFTFSVAASAAEFAFSPEGSNIVQEYLDNGVGCNIGALETPDSCWNTLSTSNELISQSALPNHPSGTQTTLKFRAESGSSNSQPAGTYTATTTLTAVAL
ncbi:MAG: hypothetical protein A3E94_01325 [Candidatus Zambryskibacteria bacterium RIFCSPHIGHO2_12_FULL_44_12b]|nr:MAG: hypothetical protein A3E94_01325 [Candidatus Zambryskibacteria bacterium RIFCSPHIGHO2_12_FULL_44_12b]